MLCNNHAMQNRIWPIMWHRSVCKCPYAILLRAPKITMNMSIINQSWKSLRSSSSWPFFFFSIDLRKNITLVINTMVKSDSISRLLKIWCHPSPVFFAWYSIMKTLLWLEQRIILSSWGQAWGEDEGDLEGLGYSLQQYLRSISYINVQWNNKCDKHKCESI